MAIIELGISAVVAAWLAKLLTQSHLLNPLLLLGTGLISAWLAREVFGVLGLYMLGLAGHIFLATALTVTLIVGTQRAARLRRKP